MPSQDHKWTAVERTNLVAKFFATFKRFPLVSHDQTMDERATLLNESLLSGTIHPELVLKPTDANERLD